MTNSGGVRRSDSEDTSDGHGDSEETSKSGGGRKQAEEKKEYPKINVRRRIYFTD